MGLVSNRTGVSSTLVYSLDYLRERYSVKVECMFSPEHGFYLTEQAGEPVPSHYDERFGVKIYSVYQHLTRESALPVGSAKGAGRKGPKEKSADYPVDAGKSLPDEVVSELDAVLFDTQDVGTRAYTQLGSMVNTMASCAKHDIDFLLLDRPNPVNGVAVQGPVLEYTRHRSFVGVYSIPLRHGMTMGEVASMINAEVYHGRVRLRVCTMENWAREMWFDDTGFPWVMPSPNMPTLATATVYTGQVLFEATNISEGRGTTKPFEIVGAPWIDGYSLACEVNSMNIPGVRAIEAKFTPTFSKFKGEKCNGIEIVVLDRNAFNGFEFSVRVLETIQRKYDGKFQLKTDAFDRLAGTSVVRESITNGSLGDLFEKVKQEDQAFEEKRRDFLLYS